MTHFLYPNMFCIDVNIYPDTFYMDVNIFFFKKNNGLVVIYLYWSKGELIIVFIMEMMESNPLNVYP